MSNLGKKLVSALVAAVSVGGFSGSVSNIACASSIACREGKVGDTLNGLIERVKESRGYDRSKSITMDGSDYVIPCLEGYVRFDVDSVRWIETSYKKSLGQILDDFFPACSKALKKYDNRLMYGAMSNFMPWISKKYIDNKLTDVSSVARWVLGRTESVNKKDLKNGAKYLRGFVGDEIFDSCEKRWDSSYDFSAICSVLYDLVKEFNEYCDKLNDLIVDGLPVNTNMVNVAVLSEFEDRADFFSRLFGGRNVVYGCVVRLANVVLELFTR